MDGTPPLATRSNRAEVRAAAPGRRAVARVTLAMVPTGMRIPGLFVAAAFTLISCDTKKLGAEGSTCSASSDCVDDLQCMQSTCVRPQVAANAMRSPQPPASAPAPVPAASPGVSAPAALSAAPVATSSTPVSVAQPTMPAPVAQPNAPVAQPAAPVLVAPEVPSPSRVVTTDVPLAAPANPTEPAFTFADPASWTVLDKAKDPWAVAILTALRAIRVGTYAGASAPMTYKFQLKVCPDGRMTANRKGGTAEAQVMGMIDGVIENLPPIAPPPAVRSQLAGACKRIPYVFTMRLANGKTDVE